MDASDSEEEADRLSTEDNSPAKSPHARDQHGGSRAQAPEPGGSPAPGGHMSVPDLIKRFRNLRREYAAKQRDMATRLMASHTTALRSFLGRELQQAQALPSLPVPPSGAGEPGAVSAVGLPLPAAVLLPLQRRVVSFKLGGEEARVRLQPRVMPAAHAPPAYAHWSYLRRNEVARDHGRRMYLVDEHGETVPADDGEGAQLLPWYRSDCASIDWAITRLCEEAGGRWRDPDVLEALLVALRMEAQGQVLLQHVERLHQLAVGRAARPGQQFSDAAEVYHKAFCRRCRVYCCNTHGGEHVQPHHQPAPPPSSACAQPCGPGCWQHARAAAAAAAMSASAGGVPPKASPAAPPGAEPMDTDAPGGGSSGAEQQAAGGHAGASGAGGPSLHHGVDQQQQQGQRALSVYERSLIERGVEVFGAASACMVACLMGPARTCAQVKAAMDEMGFGAAAAAAAALPGRGSGAGGPVLELAPAAAAEPAAAAAAAAAALQLGADGGDGDGAAAGVAGPVLQAAALGRVPARRKGMRKAVLGSANLKQSRSFVARSRTQHSDSDLWQEYSPCECVGRCRASCPCVAARNFCEKFCACSAACRERFRGCSCKGGCKNNQCPCAAAGRECDPDLCAGCAPTLEAALGLGLGGGAEGPALQGPPALEPSRDREGPEGAAAAAAEPCRDGPQGPSLEAALQAEGLLQQGAPALEPGRECHNMRLRLRQHARVVLGTSDIPGAGWGVFSVDALPRNSFLGEYTGDLITQEEANRRGLVYDVMNSSYLFNCNTQWVVDAKFRGNKLRCANHAPEPVASAKVLLVDGESRIAVITDKRVEAGTEITYDYRYSDDLAPHWVRPKKKKTPAAAGAGAGAGGPGGHCQQE